MQVASRTVARLHRTEQRHYGRREPAEELADACVRQFHVRLPQQVSGDEEPDSGRMELSEACPRLLKRQDEKAAESADSDHPANLVASAAPGFGLWPSS